MSTISDTATVTLSVNGEQAKKEIATLQEKIRKTTEEIERLSNTGGDPKQIAVLEKELEKTEKQLNKIISEATMVEKTLNNLDKASPRELEKTLRTLKKHFKDAEQGSEAYYELADQIHAVKEQLESVREDIDGSESTWIKFRTWVYNSFPALTLINGTKDAVIEYAQEFVGAYSDMEQEMANVRKYTGMTEEDVARLNEEFKKMDTRTSREELNKLAQEAGRLGKTSVDEVLGFVAASDKINVALDDLGEGATLTLSKLTTIFGDEDRLGTEQALLSVGSVINELSQNCAASAPYITEFASRLGGVGAQANMTVQQIMAYGAVLDSNQAALEVSATSLSNVMVHLYQEPAKYAKIAGLDIQAFTKMVKEDMNGALITLLESLKDAGGMDNLSRMFKDMDENGSGVVSTLSTLAGNIDKVKEQQQAANEAFAAASSIDAEFEVQNNTVAASLEKFNNRLQELKVTLGEELYPLADYFVSSGAAVMEAIQRCIKFIIDYKGTIITLTAAVSTYIALVKVQEVWEERLVVKKILLDKWTKICAATQKGLNTAMRAGRLIVAGLTNAVQYFTKSLRVSYEMQERWRKSMQAMNFASWATAILAVGAAVYALVKRFNQLDETEKVMADIRKKCRRSGSQSEARHRGSCEGGTRRETLVG